MVKCKRLMEEIEESEVTEEYEFLTEEEMDGAGWSESLGFHGILLVSSINNTEPYICLPLGHLREAKAGAKAHCATRKGFIRTCPCIVLFLLINKSTKNIMYVFDKLLHGCRKCLYEDKNMYWVNVAIKGNKTLLACNFLASVASGNSRAMLKGFGLQVPWVVIVERLEGLGLASKGGGNKYETLKYFTYIYVTTYTTVLYILYHNTYIYIQWD